MKNPTLEVVAIEHPETLPDSVLQGIQRASQDAWSRVASLGELCQCQTCATIYSAEDIFTQDELSQGKLVAELLDERFGDSEILCQNVDCGEKTKLLYGPEHVKEIRARYSGSVQSFLVLCREKESGKVVGFEDGFIDTVAGATREFPHYNPSGITEEGFAGNYWVKKIERCVEEILGLSPSQILTLSSIGIVEKYQDPHTLFGILKCFAEILPENYSIPGITEVDKRNTMYKLSLGIGGKIVPIQGNPQRMREEYQSHLFVYPDPIKMYKERFTQGARGFVKLLREIQPELVGAG